MKTFARALAFLAVVHLLTLALVAGWLVATNRVNRERLDAVRAIFAPTIDQEAAAAEDAAAAEAEANEIALAAWREENPQPPSAVQIEYVARMERRTEEIRRRAQTEVEQLRDQLARAEAQLAQERAQFLAERDAWDERQEALRARTRDAQFAKVVALLEQLPPKRSKEMILGWIQEGAIDEAAGYLNAMKKYNAGLVLKEFKSPAEQEVAGDLLRRLESIDSAGSTQETPPPDDETAGDPDDPA